MGKGEAVHREEQHQRQSALRPHREEVSGRLFLGGVQDRGRARGDPNQGHNVRTVRRFEPCAPAEQIRSQNGRKGFVQGGGKVGEHKLIQRLHGVQFGQRRAKAGVRRNGVRADQPIE